MAAPAHREVQVEALAEPDFECVDALAPSPEPSAPPSLSLGKRR
jgi:hypothetical protein